MTRQGRTAVLALGSRPDEIPELLSRDGRVRADRIGALDARMRRALTEKPPSP